MPGDLDDRADDAQPSVVEIERIEAEPGRFTPTQAGAATDPTSARYRRGTTGSSAERNTARSIQSCTDR